MAILLVVAIISYFLDSAVVVKKESSSFDVEFAKSNQRLYKWFPPIKHFPVSRYFSQNDANTSHVNEDKSDQTRRVRRDDRGVDYGIRHVGPVYTFVNQKEKFKWGLPFRFADGSQ